MCQQLIKLGWTLIDVEEADFETLTEVACSKKNEAKKIDLMEYMKQEQGLV